MPKPVIAAVNGVAAGAGASMAFACDFRVVADTAGFNLAFTGIALSCDTGISWTLPRLVGRPRRRSCCASPARSPPPRRSSSAWPPRSSRPPRSTARRRLAGRLGRRADCRLRRGPAVARVLGRPDTLAESLDFEAGKMQLTGDTEDHRNAVASFVAKQKPTFEGR